MLRTGWCKDEVGSHIVRNNVISDCEQTGICGSMGAAFSEIYGNHIYNILVKQQFGGAEMAGIKLHGAIDTYIHNNRIHKVGNFGIWLDWMAQGARVSSNLLYDNLAQDLFFEVDHGPYVVDNNILLSPRSIQENSDGGAYFHNLITGDINCLDDMRYTPYHLNHSTEVKGLRTITCGDHRFYNNIFVGRAKGQAKYGLIVYDAAKLPIYAAGNLFCGGAKPMTDKEQGHVAADYDPQITLEETSDEVYLKFTVDDASVAGLQTRPVKARSVETPTPGPIEGVSSGSQRLKVW